MPPTVAEFSTSLSDKIVWIVTKRRRGRQRISAIAGRRRARQRERLRGHDLVRRNERAHRESRRHPFAERHDVGNHVVVIAAEHSAGAAEPGDHLVGDQQTRRIRGRRRHIAQKSGGGTMLPAVP